MNRSSTCSGLLALVLLPLALVLATAAPAAPATWRIDVDPQVAWTDPAEYEDRVLAQVNKRRARHDRPRIRLFWSCLDDFSESWSRRLARTGELVHRDQDKVAEACDMPWVGENLVRGFSMTPRAAVRAWWRSPDHRRVMMKARADRAGVAVRRTEEGGYVLVLNVGDTR